MSRILVVDDEENLCFTFRRFLEREGHQVRTARNLDDARELLGHDDFDLLFLDIMLGRDSGLDLLREMRSERPGVPVVLITGAPSVETASAALRLGAYDYILKPLRQEELLKAARQALKFRTAGLERERYRRNFEAIMRSVHEAIITFDTEGRITQANEAACRICGIGPEHLGRLLSEADNGCMKKCVAPLKRALETRVPGELQRMECVQRERTLVVSATVAPLIDGQRQVAGAVLLVRDETDLRKLESRIKERSQLQDLIGRSEPMQELYGLIEELAHLPTTVLISGESGTGKELVAEAIHYLGNRHDQPLVKVNCAALPESLLESELFGHVRGAFTGALKDKKGRFELAHGGTIFLDEIGDISAAMQVRLLRVLQEREIERVGEGRPRKVDVRVIAATHRDLTARVARGQFREDLYYRLKVVNLEVPALRQREGDLSILVEHFINRLNKKLGREVVGLSRDAMERLEAHGWPGNVRELEHVLENAMVLCRRAAVISAEHLCLGPGGGGESPNGGSEASSLVDALRKAGGNKSKAARLLGMSRPTLYRKIREYGLES